MILVTGATGNVGRQVVSQLLAAGASIRALTRNPDAARLPAGVDVARADLSDPDSVARSLDGIETVFLVWPFLTAQTEAAPAVIDAIAKHARRVVYLSSMNARESPGQQHDPSDVFGEIERLIERSGLQWTFLQPGGFAANTLAWAPQIRTHAIVRWPYGAAARSLIHERDIAAVAVRALTGEGHNGARYVLTGPEALTQIEQVRVIGEVIGRPLRWEELSPQAARRQLLSEGWPASFTDSALDYWAALVTAPEPVTATVEQVTGALARSFREWASDHADDFR